MTLVQTALVLLLSASSQAAEPVLPDFVPPGTSLVAGLSVRGIVDSPLVKAYLADAKIMTADYLKGTALASLDPFRDIDELIITAAGQGEKAPALIVMRGRFNLQTLGAGMKLYHEVPILDGAKNTSALALLDAATAIAGEPAQVRAAIDRRGQTTHHAAALVERVQALATRYDIWGVGDVPKGAMPASATRSPELQAIDRFEFGASLRQGLELTAQIHLRSSKDTEKMLATVQLLEAMLKLQTPPSSGSKFELQSNQDNVRLSIFIPEEELKKGIEARKATFSSSLKSEATTAPPKPSIVPAPSSVLPKAGVVKNDRGDAVTVTLPGTKFP